MHDLQVNIQYDLDSTDVVFQHPSINFDLLNPHLKMVCIFKAYRCVKFTPIMICRCGKLAHQWLEMALYALKLHIDLLFRQTIQISLQSGIMPLIPLKHILNHISRKPIFLLLFLVSFLTNGIDKYLTEFSCTLFLTYFFLFISGNVNS